MCVVAGIAGVTGPSVRAAQLVDVNANHVTLAVDARGEALVTYTAAGTVKHVLARGAMNALPPSQNGSQVRFKMDHSGGWRWYRKSAWKTFKNSCRPYDGSDLHWPWLFVGCDAPDGSYWAVQSFPEDLPDLGFTPWTAKQHAMVLRLSHWSGALPELQVWQDWVYGGRFNEIFGQLTYHGAPVYGFTSTQYGAPTDSFGRLVYLDTFDSTYGPGWNRENAFLTHQGNGIFCYGFYPIDPTTGGNQHPPGYTGGDRGPGTGSSYRLIINGPGVTPSIVWTAPALGAFDKSSQQDIDYQAQMTAQLKAISGSDTTCLAGH
jgi:hypothetical protein